MRNNYSFLQLSDTITQIALLPIEVKEKKKPFVIVNTDDDRGLYVKALEKEIAKYKNIKSETGESLFLDVETGNLIIFGDSTNFDYRVNMNYVTLVSLAGKKDLKVYNLVEDFNKITRRLSTYCRNNGIKRRVAYRCSEPTVRFNVINTNPTVCPQTCPLLASLQPTKTLVNVYQKPNLSLEEITVHAYWVKIGYNQYDIWVDLCGNEFIILEDGEKLFVKTDRFGRRYLSTTA